MEEVNVVAAKSFDDGQPKKVNYIKTDQLGQDTYYFSAGQVLEYHRHPEGDQIFFVQEGEGTFHLDGGTEETTALKPGFCCSGAEECVAQDCRHNGADRQPGDTPARGHGGSVVIIFTP